MNISLIRLSATHSREPTWHDRNREKDPTHLAICEACHTTTVDFTLIVISFYMVFFGCLGAFAGPFPLLNLVLHPAINFNIGKLE